MADELKCPNCGKPVPEGSPLGICPECLLQVGVETPGGTNLGATPPANHLPHPAPDQLAPYFPQLEIREFIARGGMGAVYKARQPNLDRLVALKILLLPEASDPNFPERFQREARSLARLNHPNILAVHDFGKTGGYCYLIMEFVDGVNLRQIEQAGELTPREALKIIPQVCAALQFAHDEGIVHRDIKPENILVDKKGRVKIADFGLAKLLGPASPTQNFTRGNYVMGTPHYMAPEQIEHPLQVDHRADIYSLGVVFYEMLTGELPLGRFASPSQKVRIDVRLDEVVLRTLEKEPALRYQHASEVKTAVETIATGKAPELPPAPTTSAAASVPPPPGRRPFRRFAIFAGLILLPVIFAAIALFTQNSTATKPAPAPSVETTPATPIKSTPASPAPAPAPPPAPAAPAATAPVAPTVGELHIVSGGGDFAAISTTNKTLTVLPGAKLFGSINLQARNSGPANALAPLIYTPSWGVPSESWHTIQSSLPVGQTNPVAHISLTAPDVPGVYHLIFAFQWEIDGDYVASTTNWSADASQWQSGGDLASLSAPQIAAAQSRGAVMVNWLMRDNPLTYTLQLTPLDALNVVVTDSGGTIAIKP
jgi:serine/threonine protein kinase